MADVLAVVLTIAFFALAYGVVLLCDRVIGPDADVLTTSPANTSPTPTDTDPALAGATK